MSGVIKRNFAFLKVVLGYITFNFVHCDLVFCSFNILFIGLKLREEFTLKKLYIFENTYLYEGQLNKIL